jgi:hypothetical protein
MGGGIRPRAQRGMLVVVGGGRGSRRVFGEGGVVGLGGWMGGIWG